MNLLLLPILIPFVAGFLSLALRKERAYIKEILALLATASTLAIAGGLFHEKMTFLYPWAGLGMDFSLKLDPFNSFILLAASLFGFLITLYSLAFAREKKYPNLFYAYLLLTLSFAQGAILANNFVVLLFFWEGLLVTLFAFIALGSSTAWKTALKAFIIVGASDLCMMLGIALTAYITNTLAISETHLPFTTLGTTAFVLLMIGAVAKAGCLPFHTWIPDAALDAPLPFMALMPAALEKLLGIYFLARLSLEIFPFAPLSGISIVMMTLGCVTILVAVLMALIQKDYKKLLAYHAISQVGYMILGIGTALPAGIIGGLFHMVNNAIYKCCLFLTGGAIEKQTGTTDLNKLGGVMRKMPVTFFCFFIAAASISGVPPFNGFFSKELLYEGALNCGWIFYAAALLGSFFTAASFLKLGHAAYVDRPRSEMNHVKEAPVSMLVPMIFLAALCIFFGVYNVFPIHHFLEPILGEELLEGQHFGGFPHDMMLVAMTVGILALAFVNHLVGAKKTGHGLGAVDHIHYAPVLHGIYDKAEDKFFDPYVLGLKSLKVLARIGFALDKSIDFIYNKAIVSLGYGCSHLIRVCHNGSYENYLVWSLLGFTAMIVYIFFLRGA